MPCVHPEINSCSDCTHRGAAGVRLGLTSCPLQPLRARSQCRHTLAEVAPMTCIRLRFRLKLYPWLTWMSRCSAQTSIDMGDGFPSRILTLGLTFFMFPRDYRVPLQGALRLACSRFKDNQSISDWRVGWAHALTPEQEASPPLLDLAPPWFLYDVLLPPVSCLTPRAAHIRD